MSWEVDRGKGCCEESGAGGGRGPGVRSGHVLGELARAAGPSANVLGQLQGAGLEPPDGGSPLGYTPGWVWQGSARGFLLASMGGMTVG